MANEPDDILITTCLSTVPEVRIFHVGQCLFVFFFFFIILLFLCFPSFAAAAIAAGERFSCWANLGSKSDLVSRQRFWHADITCYWYSCFAWYVPPSSSYRRRTFTPYFPKVMTLNPLTLTSTASGTMCPTTSYPETCRPGWKSSATWPHRRPASS